MLVHEVRDEEHHRGNGLLRQAEICTEFNTILAQQEQPLTTPRQFYQKHL